MTLGPSGPKLLYINILANLNKKERKNNNAHQMRYAIDELTFISTTPVDGVFTVQIVRDQKCVYGTRRLGKFDLFSRDNLIVYHRISSEDC